MRGKEYCSVILEEDGGCVVVYVEKEDAEGEKKTGVEGVEEEEEEEEERGRKGRGRH